MLTAMSANYYERLEQTRGPQPSASMLGTLARTLRLTGDETEYLYTLVGQNLFTGTKIVENPAVQAKTTRRLILN